MTSKNYLSVVGISDTHGKHAQTRFKEWDTGEYDMIVHSGDISNIGDPAEILNFMDWYGNLTMSHKILIFGNHELNTEHNTDFYREQASKRNITFLHHEHITIEGIKIFGSPYTPVYGNWAYNVNRDDLEYYWAEIDEDVDLLVTHGPPFGVGDRTGRNDAVGCTHLLKSILEKNIQVCQFGHIHEDRGEIFTEQTFPRTKFYNASMVIGYPYKVLDTPVYYKLHKKDA